MAANCSVLTSTLSTNCTDFAHFLSTEVADLTADHWDSYYYNFMLLAVSVAMVIGFVFPVGQFELTTALRRARAAGLTQAFWMPFNWGLSPIIYENADGVTAAISIKDGTWTEVTDMKRADLFDASMYAHDQMPPILYGSMWFVIGGLITGICSMIFSSWYTGVFAGTMSGILNKYAFYTFLSAILSYKGWAIITVITWAPEMLGPYDVMTNFRFMQENRHYYGSMLMGGAHATAVALYWTAFVMFIRPNVGRSVGHHLAVFAEGSPVLDKLTYSVFIIVGTFLTYTWATFCASLYKSYSGNHRLEATEYNKLAATDADLYNSRINHGSVPLAEMGRTARTAASAAAKRAGAGSLF